MCLLPLLCWLLLSAGCFSKVISSLHLILVPWRCRPVAQSDQDLSSQAALVSHFVSRLIHSCHISVLFFFPFYSQSPQLVSGIMTLVFGSAVWELSCRLKFSVLLLVLRYWNQTFFGNGYMRDGIFCQFYIGGRRRSRGRTKALTATWRVP